MNQTLEVLLFYLDVPLILVATTPDKSCSKNQKLISRWANLNQETGISEKILNFRNLVIILSKNSGRGVEAVRWVNLNQETGISEKILNFRNLVIILSKNSGRGVEAVRWVNLNQGIGILEKILLPIAINEGNQNLCNLQELFYFCIFDAKS